MAYYVGLTDDLDRRRGEHGNPRDWQMTGPFLSEARAREWEQQQLAKLDVQGGPGGAGWRYGYWYTITPRTIQ